MANSINWGKIYETTYWGVGVTNNNISWGKIYLEEAGFSVLAQRYETRVVADGGTVESERCLDDTDYKNNNWTYCYRVIDDGGVVDSLECVDIN